MGEGEEGIPHEPLKSPATGSIGVIRKKAEQSNKMLQVLYIWPFNR
jgi:hypothetical protein